MASELIERDIYGGDIHIVHNPNARGRAPRYKVSVDGQETKPKGVTTIMGQTLAKDLMDWAVSCSLEYIRLKLPVVTEADLVVAAKAYTVKRDAGGSTGTEAHALVEEFLKGRQGQISDASQEARNAYEAFVRWFTETKPQVLNVEEVIYSKHYEYAGTYDCMLGIGEKVCLADYKTTNASRKAPNGVYAENFLQLGAYALAHEEQRAYEEKKGGTKLLPVDDLVVISCQKSGLLNVVSASDLGLTVKDCVEMWKRLINLYSFLQYTTQKLGGK